MARPPRLQIAGAWYHVVAHGIERRVVFQRDRDRAHFLELLGAATERFAWNISACVLMENHFHLFLQTLEPNLSRAMQWLCPRFFDARGTISSAVTSGATVLPRF